MKKFLTILSAIVCLIVFAFTGCTSNDNFSKKQYVYDETVVQSIEMDVTDRLIEVDRSQDEKIYIEYFDGEKESLAFEIQDTDTLKIKLKHDKKWSDFIGSKPSAQYRKIIVKLPNSVSHITIKTTNGNIQINSLAIAEKITLANNGGNIEINEINVQKELSLNAKNGNITGTVIGGWDDFSIKCEIKKGKSNLPENKEGGLKTLNAKCNNGNINIDFIK